jgi:(E)-4-hydroxy-3-methylbut-2-enyl-diphosphate synthase
MIPNHLNIHDKLYTSSVILVGSVALGGSHPVRIQSMTNTDTLDTQSSVNQCIRIIEAGADFVRLTAQGVKEAENLASIKKELYKAGFETPLIADIHFNPSAAEVAAGIVEKVRINPGNYADKRASFIQYDLTDKEYEEELERIHSRLIPLINICHLNKTTIRIGVNHGSLSDRIMTRYGNTPEGMAVSAMEFIKIMRVENFHKLVVSMKSSDTAVMIRANRILVSMMKEEGLSYPIHLGITEAGEGEDGRVRSSAGIGALLAEGIGDTIRVSLSEDPENEIPVCKSIAAYYPREIVTQKPDQPLSFKSPSQKPGFFRKITGPLVLADFTDEGEINKNVFLNAGYITDKNSGNIIRTDGSPDIILASGCPDNIPENVTLALPLNLWKNDMPRKNCLPLVTSEEYSEMASLKSIPKIIVLQPENPVEKLIETDSQTDILLYRFRPDQDRYSADRFLNSLSYNNLNLSVILNPVFCENNIEALMVKAPALLGRYISDKYISGICITNKGKTDKGGFVSLCFSILQCTAARITRTIYLSCPTCGRTKFNLQKAVKEVKRVTGHLKGLKIAVMGCIVNGPGEMAGADYGYVGAAAGKVHIYRGTTPVLRNIDEKEAPAELLRLIEKDQASL